MEALSLIHKQLAIERVGLDEDGLLIRVPGPDPDEIGRVYAYHYEGDYLTYFRRDVPAPIGEQIATLGAKAVFHDRGAVTALLALDSPCTEVGLFHTYVFSESLSPCQYPDAVRLGETHRELMAAYHGASNATERPVYAVIRDGMIVSTCESVREGEEAGECYVFTRPKYRRRGYGRQVTAAWGHHLTKQEKVAFYSHAEENAASRAVARSLGLRLRFSVRTYS